MLTIGSAPNHQHVPNRTEIIFEDGCWAFLKAVSLSPVIKFIGLKLPSEKIGRWWSQRLNFVHSLFPWVLCSSDDSGLAKGLPSPNTDRTSTDRGRGGKRIEVVQENFLLLRLKLIYSRTSLKRCWLKKKENSTFFVNVTEKGNIWESRLVPRSQGQALGTRLLKCTARGSCCLPWQKLSRKIHGQIKTSS